jgi:hypothetical protein
VRSRASSAAGWLYEPRWSQLKPWWAAYTCTVTPGWAQSLQFTNPPALGSPATYTHVVRAGKTLYIAGQVAAGADGKVVGPGMADQVRQVIRSIRGFDDKWYIILVGVIFLFFVANTLFNVIKDSLNHLWQISVKEKTGFLFILIVRLRSFAVILFVGALFLADIFFLGISVCT